MPRGSILASHPAAPDSIPSIPQKFSKEKNIDVAEVNQRHWLKESGYWLDKADQTLLVLISCQHYFTKRINIITINVVRITIKSEYVIICVPKCRNAEFFIQFGFAESELIFY